MCCCKEIKKLRKELRELRADFDALEEASTFGVMDGEDCEIYSVWAVFMVLLSHLGLQLALGVSGELILVPKE